MISEGDKLADDIRQLRILPSQDKTKSRSAIQQLCLSCASKRVDGIEKARGLPPGTKCDLCNSPAVIAVELRPR